MDTLQGFCRFIESSISLFLIFNFLFPEIPNDFFVEDGTIGNWVADDVDVIATVVDDDVTTAVDDDDTTAVDGDGVVVDVSITAAVFDINGGLQCFYSSLRVLLMGKRIVQE